MPFNSYSYLGLLLAIVTGFWILPPRLRALYVLAVSICYYATWNRYFVALPLGLAIVVFLLARRIVGQRDWARRGAAVGVVFVIGVLAFFKYRQFFAQNLSAAFSALGAPHLHWTLAIGVPLGISFYSFEAISYLIDCRQGRIAKPQFLTLYNFLMFWPHLMAGPIVRVRELIPQLTTPKKFDSRFLIAGLDRLFWGLVQKVAVANPMGKFVEDGFKAGAVHSSFDNWVLAIAFGLQIYFDFAGYSNMAIGAAQMVGIKLPENFRFPYHASSPADFWTRWHMTLSRWIRDYLFFPINAKYRGAPVPLYISLLGVMAAVGLWHGAGWGFVLWGVLHGAYLVGYRIWEEAQTKRGQRFAAKSEIPASIAATAAAEGTASASIDAVEAGDPPLPKSPWGEKAWAAAWQVFTLIAVTAAWIPFRASSIAQSGKMLRSMFLGFTGTRTFSPVFYLFVAAMVVFCALEPLLARGMAWADDKVTSTGSWMNLALMRLPLYTSALMLFMIFDQLDTQFIYFQF